MCNSHGARPAIGVLAEPLLLHPPPSQLLPGAARRRRGRGSGATPWSENAVLGAWFRRPAKGARLACRAQRELEPKLDGCAPIDGAFNANFASASIYRYILALSFGKTASEPMIPVHFGTWETEGALPQGPRQERVSAHAKALSAFGCRASVWGAQASAGGAVRGWRTCRLRQEDRKVTLATSEH